MMRPSNGCLQMAAARAKIAGEKGGNEVEKADAQEADEAVHAAEHSAVQGADAVVM